MPKGEKKFGARNGRDGSGGGAGQGDFTLDEFANADPKVTPSKSGRMKKSVVNTDANNIVSKSLTAKENMGTLAWYEKDLSDYSDDETLTIELQEVDENIEKADSTKKKKRSKLSHCQSEGKTYPADVWHLISDYLCPESVCKFALLCHDSHRVTHTVCFWQRLYKRCYVSGIELLPHRLHPQCIRRVHGLRSLVIAALYHVYPPFVSRLQSKTPMEADPDQLLGARCLLIWYAKVKDLWHFYFKFRLPRGRRCWLRHQGPEMDFLAADDVYYNPEDNCCILQVVLQHFVSLPVCVMGQVLVQSSVSVGHGMRYHKLRLLFSTERVHGKGLLGNGTSVCLDPVLNIFVTHWWSPKYPLHKP